MDTNPDNPRNGAQDTTGLGGVGTRSVVLLQSVTWPEGPGVCCWRGGVHAVFTELGFAVHQLPGVEPSAESPADAGAAERVAQPDLAQQPPVPAADAVRRPFVVRALRRVVRVGGTRARQVGRVTYRAVGRRLAAVRPGSTSSAGSGDRAAAGTPPAAKKQATKPGAQAVSGTDGADVPGSGPGGSVLAGNGAAAEPVDPRLAGLASARLVIAETERDVLAAVHAGVPAARVWLLAVPPERVAPGEPVGWAGGLRDAVSSIGGVIADSYDAAGVLERVLGHVRTVVLPPLAHDRPCPRCADLPSSEPADGAPIKGTQAQPYLELWWRLGRTPGESESYSYAAARFGAGHSGARPPELASWGLPGAEPKVEPSDIEWDRKAQRVGARRLLAMLPPALELAPDSEPRRVRVFGTDMRFMRELANRLDDRADLNVEVDEWRSAGAKNDGITEPLARGAHTLVAEWCRPNAVWLSEVKRPDQQLIVRLHRFEVEAAYPKQLDIDQVDAVVYVSPHMGRRIRDELGWPAEKLVYAPLYIDAPRFDRPKFPGAQFTLGMVGIVPRLKRLELALDLLAEVRREDPRFNLLIRSQMGWTHKPSWQQPAEREYVHRCLERIEKDPLLRGAVDISYGADMPAWFRKVGQVLSLSDVESFHAGLAEGMASGAVPVVRGWPGASELYGEHWIRGGVDDAAASVLSAADPGVWAARSERAKAEVAERFAPDRVIDAWADLSLGRVSEAARRFPTGLAV